MSQATELKSSYDVIVLGGGHNGLVFQAYLSRAGLSTLCLERRDAAGGASVTVESPSGSGHFHNTHSFFHRGITGMPWYRDLGLASRGLEYLEPELNTAVLLENGESLQWWTDLERTIASFGNFDERDGRRLREWHDRFKPIVEEILVPESQRPPMPAEDRERQLRQTAEGRLLLAVSRLSPVEFVEREFRHTTVRAGLLFFNGLREVDLRCKGFGHHIPALLASKSRPQMARGGSAQLGRSLESVIREQGGDICCGVDIKEVHVESGRAVGVELSDGRSIRANRMVVSSLNPQQTFLDLLDPGVLPAEWRRRAEGFQYNLLAPLFGLYANLKEPPHYRAAEKDPEVENALMIVIGLERYEQFQDIVTHHERGTIPDPVMWGACPTLFDASQAPGGKHSAFLWEKLPYHLKGDARNWESYRERHGADRLCFWEKYAPNLRDAVEHTFTKSALNIFQDYPNMQGGDLLVGSFENGQVGYDRPFPGAGHYRTCLEGLYLCGSSSAPGGNITGLPGYNAAQVAMSDLSLS